MVSKTKESKRAHPKRAAGIGDLVLTFTTTRYVKAITAHEKKNETLYSACLIPIGTPGVVINIDRWNRYFVLFPLGSFWVWDSDVRSMDWVEMRNSWKAPKA